MSHSAIKRLNYTVDLNETTRKVYLDGVFVTDDHEGHQFDLRLYRGNTPVQLPSGVAVHGYFIRHSDNTTLTLPNGTASGNVASIKLPGDCYALPGQFSLVIKVIEGESISALFYAEGSIVCSKTGNVIDSGNVIPNLDELLAMIADMEAAASDGRAAAQEARDAGAEAVGIAQDAAGEALAAAQTVQSIYDFKADAIMDESARAASHSLHAQDGPLSVTLYGKTTETGTGDKSPDNPYTISGVSAARVHAGGKNLFNTPEASATVRNVTYTLDGKGTIKISGTNATAGNIFMLDIPNPITIQAGMRIVIDATEASSEHGFNFRNTATGNYRSLNVQPGKVTTFDVGAYHAGQTFNHFRDWIFTNAVYNDTLKIMFTYSRDTSYEPYTANVITPALLPDGAPLMGNGTVDDTIENDVLSGCDKKLVLNSSNGWVLSPESSLSKISFSSIKLMPDYYVDDIGCAVYADKLTILKVNGISDASKMEGLSVYYKGASQIDKLLYLSITGVTTLDELDAYLAANPLTVYYRSTEYTPENDLRVCKTVRRWRTVTLDGSSDEAYTAGATTVSGVKRFLVGAIADCMTANTNYAVGNIVCDRLDTMAIQYGTYAGVQSIGVDSSKRVYICVDGVTDEAGLRAFLVEKPLEVTYQIVTEQTYMTDPLDLRKPTGIMPVTVTGSTETSVSYPHDTADWGKCAASTMIGAAESGMTATKNYAIGDFIVDKDALTLYRATKAIASGEAIVPGTNCTATTVVEQLSAIYTILNA